MKKKVVLAFSGGLDTSFCVPYLKNEKGLEVHTIMVNSGGFSKEEEKAIEIIKEAVRAIRTVRTSMNVPPSRKAKVYVVSESEEIRSVFKNGKVFFATLASASEVAVQTDKTGIAEDAVSAVIPGANIYIPFADLVDIEKEIERLKKEEAKLSKEIARSKGMLSNEKFISKAPEAKIEEEKAKFEKYQQMMAQVQERLAQLSK